MELILVNINKLYKMKTTLNFRNTVQAALFECELSGQISDGNWENSRPYDHWKFLNDLQVGVNPENLGRNFYSVKKSYNFNDGELFKVVGDRMINIANMAENNVPLQAINDFNDYEFEDLKRKEQYWKNKRKEFLEYFGSWENYQSKLKGSYDAKKVRKELKDMTEIFKTQNY